MTREDITELYHTYIACLNAQDWDALHQFVAEDVEYNGQIIGLAGYQAMLVADFKAIPDLYFTITRLACDPPMIACGLSFDCTPIGQLFGLAVNGTPVQFSENVFYEISRGKIHKVWSIIDKAAIAAQL
nr:ester cyclase [Amylibacter sp.]